jgi:hypothetical protein
MPMPAPDARALRERHLASLCLDVNVRIRHGQAYHLVSTDGIYPAGLWSGSNDGLIQGERSLAFSLFTSLRGVPGLTPGSTRPDSQLDRNSFLINYLSLNVVFSTFCSLTRVSSAFSFYSPWRSKPNLFSSSSVLPHRRTLSVSIVQLTDPSLPDCFAVFQSSMVLGGGLAACFVSRSSSSFLHLTHVVATKLINSSSIVQGDILLAFLMVCKVSPPGGFLSNLASARSFPVVVRSIHVTFSPAWSPVSLTSVSFYSSTSHGFFGSSSPLASRLLARPTRASSNI